MVESSLQMRDGSRGGGHSRLGVEGRRSGVSNFQGECSASDADHGSRWNLRFQGIAAPDAVLELPSNGQRGGGEKEQSEVFHGALQSNAAIRNFGGQRFPEAERDVRRNGPTGS